jgi:hypothetical protein
MSQRRVESMTVADATPMLLEACVRVLYWVYVGEQILQRDVSSVIHAAHVFEELCAIFENRNVREIQRISPLLLADANVDGLRRARSTAQSLCEFPLWSQVNS